MEKTLKGDGPLDDIWKYRVDQDSCTQFGKLLKARTEHVVMNVSDIANFFSKIYFFCSCVKLFVNIFTSKFIDKDGDPWENT